MNLISEAATMVVEVSPMGETVPSVDLLTVSQQLDQIIVWQAGQIALLSALVGCILGLALACIVGRLWR